MAKASKFISPTDRLDKRADAAVDAHRSKIRSREKSMRTSPTGRRVQARRASSRH